MEMSNEPLLDYFTICLLFQVIYCYSK